MRRSRTSSFRSTSTSGRRTSPRPQRDSLAIAREAGTQADQLRPDGAQQLAVHVELLLRAIYRSSWPKLKWVSVGERRRLDPRRPRAIDYEYRDDFPGSAAPERPPAHEMFRTQSSTPASGSSTPGLAPASSDIGVDNVMWETDFPAPDLSLSPRRSSARPRCFGTSTRPSCERSCRTTPPSCTRSSFRASGRRTHAPKSPTGSMARRVPPHSGSATPPEQAGDARGRARWRSANASDVDAACQAPLRVSPQWASNPTAGTLEGPRFLRRCALRERADDFAALEHGRDGKPLAAAKSEILVLCGVSRLLRRCDPWLSRLDARSRRRSPHLLRARALRRRRHHHALERTAQSGAPRHRAGARRRQCRGRQALRVHLLDDRGLCAAGERGGIAPTDSST